MADVGMSDFGIPVIGRLGISFDAFVLGLPWLHPGWRMAAFQACANNNKYHNLPCQIN